MISLEPQCWSNSQYSRRECLEISGFPESLKKEDLEGTVLKVDLSNVEDCHRVASRTIKKVIIELSRRKDGNKIRRVKKSLKDLNLSSLGIKNPVFINDSLCIYYKMLGVNVRNFLQTGRFMPSGFQMALSD